MKNNTLIYGIIILLIAGWFYWFQYRPMMARKTCYNQTLGQYNGTWANGKVWQYGNYTKGYGWYYPQQTSKEWTAQSYAECLIQHGMKAEDPFLN